MVMGIIIQEVKGLTKKLYFVLLSMRKTRFNAKFQVHCSHHFPVFTWLLHYNVLSGLLITMHYPGRKTASSLVLQLVSSLLHED